LEKYEAISDFVVSNSAKKLGTKPDKDGNVLYRVVVITEDYRS